MTERRVLHVANGEYFGGSARVLTNFLLSRARRSAVAVGVLFPGELQERCIAAGVRTELVPMRSRIDLGAARHVIRMARDFEANVIHTHQVRNTLVGRIAGTFTGIPVVTHVHSPAMRESTNRLRNTATATVDRLLAKRSARFIPVSRSLEADLVRMGVRPDRIRVVPNGIDLPVPVTAEDRIAVRASLGAAADGDFLVGMVANFRPRKGAEVLIDAVALLSARGVDVRLALVGEPFREAGHDYGAELWERVRARDIAERVTFTGFRDDTGRVIGSMDLFVLPSLFGEGLPMVVLEAMGAGIPVLSTPIEGIAEVVRHGENGWLVDPRDPLRLADAIQELRDNPTMTSSLGLAGKKTVADGYSTDRMVAGIENVYAELVPG